MWLSQLVLIVSLLYIASWHLRRIRPAERGSEKVKGISEPKSDSSQYKSVFQTANPAMEQERSASMRDDFQEILLRAQQLPAKVLEPNLPGVSLRSWLEPALGPGAKIEWEVNDCGEQDGTRHESIPLCAAAEIKLPEDEDISVYILMATESDDERVESISAPGVWLANVRLNNAACSIKLAEIPQIAKMPKAEVEEFCQIRNCATVPTTVSHCLGKEGSSSLDH